MTYQLIIPMSGRGTRFREAGYRDLKPYIKVAGETIVAHILKMYPNRFSTLFILNESDPEIDTHIQYLRELDPEAEVALVPDRRLGPSFAIRDASDFIDTEIACVVNYCDFAGVFSDIDYVGQLTSADCCVLTYTGFHPHMLKNFKYAYVKKVENRVVNIQEKQPFTENPMNEEASAGAYAFKSGKLLLDAIELQIQGGLTLNGEYYTSLTVKPLVGNRIVSTYLMDKFYQWGTPSDLEEWKNWRHFLRALDCRDNQNPRNSEEPPNTTIILAGGKGERLKNLTNIPKALYPVKNKQMWAYSIDSNPNAINHLLIRTDLIPLLELPESPNVNVIELNQETKGQADTALIGLNSIPETKSQISFASCDNLVLDFQRMPILSSFGPNWLEVWTSRDCIEARLNPHQYSWVKSDPNGVITEYFPKQIPNGENASVVIGNFTFSNWTFAHEVLLYCVDPANDINSESYLDTAIKYCMDRHIPIVIRDVLSFKAIGNSIEYETFNYWNDCSERKYLAWN